MFRKLGSLRVIDNYYCCDSQFAKDKKIRGVVEKDKKIRGIAEKFPSFIRKKA